MSSWGDIRKEHQIAFNLLFISLILVLFALAMDVALDATLIMFAITGVALALAFSLLLGGTYVLRHSYELARACVLAYGILILIIIIGGATAFEDIAYSDQAVGAILAISGICAIASFFLYKKPRARNEIYLEGTLEKDLKENTVEPKEKEVIREKEVVVKIRCSYCQYTFDETLDKCPNCGAKR